MIHSARYLSCLAGAILVVGCSRDTKPSEERSVARASASGTAIADVDSGPTAIIRRYYDAIRNGQYDSAYALWEGAGQASGQTRTAFENGFAQTAQTTAVIGDSVSIEAAAGSQYATVPVTIDAVLRDGSHQHFIGTYTVRRAMVDGATPEQRAWHIYSAKLRKQ
jgi:hypothetical protein